MHLRGRIDRIDLCEDGDRLYLKIIDYKTGKTKFDLTDIYYGLQLRRGCLHGCGDGEDRAGIPG
ncbi:MAG: PD-(D/E)XK nuclease family protein [Clostridium fessum]